MKLDFDVLNRISATYGDSFYLLDTDVFDNNYSEMIQAFRDIYSNTRVAYSYKTNYIPRLCRRVKDMGGAAEVVSEMELWLAEKIGVEGEDIYYNGPYKKADYIEKLLLKGGHINIDSDYEAGIIEDIALRNPDVLFRIGIRCNINIGQKPLSRFGVDVASGELKRIVKYINQIPNVKVNGLHCHIPFRTLESFSRRMEYLFETLNDLPESRWDYISLGGGYMGKIDEQLARQLSYNPPTFSEYASVIAGGMKEYFAESARKPKLIIEPGSALAANAMKYATRVVDIKCIGGHYIANMAGSSFQINPAVKNVNRPVVVCHSKDENELREFDCLDMAGYTCIEDDYLYRNYQGKLGKGDFAVFDNVGSYSVVMKPPFILPDVAVLELQENGKAELIKRPQTAEDIFMYYY